MAFQGAESRKWEFFHGGGILENDGRFPPRGASAWGGGPSVRNCSGSGRAGAVLLDGEGGDN